MFTLTPFSVQRLVQFNTVFGARSLYSLWGCWLFLFLFACTNSCANPLIYGVFSAKQQGGVFASRESELTNPDMTAGRRGWVSLKCVVPHNERDVRIYSPLDWRTQIPPCRTSAVSILPSGTTHSHTNPVQPGAPTSPVLVRG